MCHGDWFMEIIQHILMPFALVICVCWNSVRVFYQSWRTKKVE